MLEGREGVRILTLETGPDLETAIDAIAASVLIVDLHEVDIAAALPVLDARPELLLVGLDPSGARLLVLSGRDASSMTSDGLLRLIERQMALVGEAAPLESAAASALPQP